MFNRIRSFVYRHKRKLVFTSFLIGGAYVLSRYVQRALREWQERETKLILERTKKQQHYESIERTCNTTALNLSCTIRDSINRVINTTELINDLKRGSSNKIEIWGKLKVLAFAKLTFLVYVTSMIVVTLRIQLNLIGGYMFRDTVEDSTKQVDVAFQEKYLSIIMHLLNEGAVRLSPLIIEKVKLLVDDKSLKEKMTIQDIEQLFWGVHAAIANDAMNPVSKFAEYVMPVVDNDEISSNALYNGVLVETRDLLESSEVTSLLTSCINRGFTYVTDNISQFFYSCARATTTDQPSSSTADEFFAANLIDVTKVAIPLAKIIPITNSLISSHNSTDDILCTWMQQLVLMDDIKIMGANVYETFSVA